MASVAKCSGESSSNLESRLSLALEAGICYGLPAVSVAITDPIWEGQQESPDNLIMCCCADGVDGQRPASTQDRYCVGSITKCFVAVVIFQLVSERKVDLEKTVSDYVKYGEAERIVRQVPNASCSTLRQLLSHQSGIPSWEFEPNWIKEARGINVDVSGRPFDGKPLASLRFATTDRCMHATGAPGESFAYSNTNYTLLGLVIEAVTGRSAHDEIRSRILNRLGLESAYLAGFETVPKTKPSSPALISHHHYSTQVYEAAAGGRHAKFTSTSLAVSNKYVVNTSLASLGPEWVAGGLVMTASDLAKFGVALRDRTLLSSEMADEMEMYNPPRNEKLVAMDSAGRKGRGRKSSDVVYCHGLSRAQLPGGALGHEGRVAFGHGGDTLGFRSRLLWSVNGGRVLAVMANVGTMHTGLDPSPFDSWCEGVLMPVVFPPA